MREETKRTLKNTFGSLISNDLAIDGAKNSPWWIGVILFILGTFIPIIPIMVTASKNYGASFASSYVYGYDQALVSCGLKLKADSYSFSVNENNELVGKKGEDVLQNTWFDNADLTPIEFYDSTIDGVTTRTLNLYYTDRPWSNKSGNSIQDMIKTLDKTYYGIGTNEIYDAEKHTLGSYVASYLILSKNGSYSKIYKYNTTTAASVTYTGMDWKHAQFAELVEYTIAVDNLEANVQDIRYVNGSFAKWKEVFNRGYLSQKLKTFWLTSGLYYGINVGLGLFLGLMMWLLTRGKRNPNRNLNIWTTVKISWWIDVAPGILGMILGFVWPAAAGIGYIVLMGLRAMWLSMRQLNPAAQ